jgi:hypothetical protein
MLLALDGKLNGEDMLTFQATGFMVRTRTMGRFWIKVDGIASMPGLLGHEPDSAFLGEGARRGDLHTTAFTLKEFLLGVFA